MVPVLNPVTNTVGRSSIPIATRIRLRRETIRTATRSIGATSRSGTATPSIHNPMIDEKGRVWFTARIPRRENPAYCKTGSDHPSAKVVPLERVRRASFRCTIRRPRNGR